MINEYFTSPAIGALNDHCHLEELEFDDVAIFIKSMKFFVQTISNVAFAKLKTLKFILQNEASIVYEYASIEYVYPSSMYIYVSGVIICSIIEKLEITISNVTIDLKRIAFLRLLEDLVIHIHIWIHLDAFNVHIETLKSIIVN